MDPVEPSITVLELVAGKYSESAHLTGTHTVRLTSPYPLDLSARALRPA